MIRYSKTIALILVLAISSSLLPEQTNAAHPVLERLSKRYFKKNKLKKLGKRAQRAAMDIDLDEYSIKFEHDVIGVEPSWMIEEGHFGEYHYFNLLSTLVIGEYDINPTNGYPRNAKAFNAHIDVKSRDRLAKENFNIIQSADYSNARLDFLIQLTYSDDFGGNIHINRRKLLNEDEVFNNLSDSLRNHFNKISKDYDIDKDRLGLYIDFSFESKVDFASYYNFLVRIKEQLDEEQKIYIVVPAEIKKRYSYSYEEINQLLEIADRIVVDASNFDKYSKYKPAPPTNFSPHSDKSLFGTLKKYLISPEISDNLPHENAHAYMIGNEVSERRSKFAVLLPYFGIEYRITGKEPNQKYDKIGKITLENFYSYEMGKAGNLKYSTNIFSKNDSIFAYLDLPIEGTKEIKRFYVDDGFTLQNKYFYLIDTLGIDNVALNALSYYKTKDRIKPMWAALALTYGKEREKLGWIIASFLMGFIPIGFVFSLYRNWEVRNVLAKYGNIWTRFIMFFVLFVFLFLTAANVIPRKGVAIVIAVVILGAFFVYIMIKKILMRSKKYVNIVK